MRELDALAIRREYDRVLANHVTGARDGKTNLRRIACPARSGAIPYRDAIEIVAARFRYDPAEHPRRTGRCVFLVAMMHFGDIAIPAGQRLRRVASEARKHRHPDAEIRAPKHRN